MPELLTKPEVPAAAARHPDAAAPEIDAAAPDAAAATAMRATVGSAAGTGAASPAGDPPARSGLPPGAMGAATLLALQRTAGNRAATGLVTRRDGRHEHGGAGSVAGRDRAGPSPDGFADPAVARAHDHETPAMSDVAPRDAERARAGRPSSPMPLQRILNPDQEKAWQSAGGDGIVSGIEGLVGQWKTFRGRPSSFDLISSFGSPRPLITLLEENPQFRQHVAEKLRASIAYLQEMAGFMHVWRLLLDLVPGLSWKDPQHQYKMTANANATINKVGFLPVQQFTIAYSNAYGWSWTRDVATAGVQWSISVSAQAGIAGPNIPDLAGGKKEASKKIKPGASGSIPGSSVSIPKGEPSKPGEPGANPLIPEFAEFNIIHAAVAKPVKYWGFEDMNGGGAIVNGPSASIKVSAAGSKAAATGGMLKLHGSNGDLDFTEFKGDVTGTFGAQVPGSVKDALNLEAKVTLASVGAIGMTTVGEATGISAPEVKKTAKAQTRTFVYTLQDFPIESGKREVPADMLASMTSDLSQLEDRVLEDAGGLRELGIDEDFKVTFTCEGFASRGWAAAVSDEMRKKKNVELSQQRADYVLGILQDKFGEVGQVFWAVGRGPALLAPASDRGPRAADVVAEDDTEGINRLVERYRLKWLDDKQRWEASLPEGAQERTPPDRLLIESYEAALRFRESLMKSNPATSTAPGAQRVNITISWSGHLLEYGTEAAGAAPAPAPSP